MDNTAIEIDLLVDVDFERDEPFEEMHNGKYYPITIKDVTFRGHSIFNYLHISHVMQIQRRVFNRLLDDGPQTIATKQGEMEI